MHSKLIHIMSILILLVYLAPADAKKRKEFKPQDHNLEDDDEARAHYQMLFQKRAQKARAWRESQEPVTYDQPRTLTWFEQIKETLMPTQKSYRQKVVVNPMVQLIEDELERLSPEPQERYNHVKSKHRSISRRRVLQDKAGATFDDNDEEPESALDDKDDDWEPDNDVDDAKHGQDSKAGDGDQTAEENGWKDSQKDDDSDSNEDPFDNVDDNDKVPDEEDDQESELGENPKKADEKEVLSDDDKDMDENNDQVEKHDDLPEEKDDDSGREVEKDNASKFYSMCHGKTDEKGTCEIKDEVIELDDTVFFSTDKVTSLIFNNTRIICNDKNKKGAFCDINIELKSAKAQSNKPAASEEGEGDETEPSKKEVVQPMISLVKGSEIRGRSVFIVIPDGRLTIDGKSSINTDGASRETKGTDERWKQGASHIGYGGYCGNYFAWFKKDMIYSGFDSKPSSGNLRSHASQVYLAGSIGMESKKETENFSVLTGGGGRVHIDVDSLYLQWQSRIRANGFPTKDHINKENLNGGSGGHVYVNTKEKVMKNNVSWYSSIEVLGGFGKNEGHGGAGGVVYFDGSFDHGIYMAEVAGGEGGNANKESKIKGCSNGASGTAYFKGIDELMLDNRNHFTDKETPINVKLNRNHTDYPDHYMLAMDVYLGRRALLTLKTSKPSTVSDLAMPHFFQHGYSTIKFDFEKTNNMALRYDNNFYVTSNTLMDFTPIKQKVKFEHHKKKGKTDWGNVNLGTIKFSKALVVEDRVNAVNLQGKISDVAETPLNDGYFYVYSQNIRLYRNAKIHVQNTFLFANHTIWAYTDSEIDSTVKNDCAADGNSKIYQCMNFDLNQNKPLKTKYLVDNYNLQYGYTEKSNNYVKIKDEEWAEGVHRIRLQVQKHWRIYLMAMEKIELSGSHLRAPRIGLCSNNIFIRRKSWVSANFRGCPADNGRGNVKRHTMCAGAGGAHGGDGGIGSSIQKTDYARDNCSKLYGVAKYEGREARLEGSGGTSGDSKEKVIGFSDNMKGGKQGGAGGGIIWLTTPNTITLEGSKVVADGHWGEMKDTDVGSGGGSGGSIQVQTQNLKGNGVFSVRGGDGSKVGGGGGSGGRFNMQFLKSFKADSQPHQSHYWKGKFSIEGGNAGKTQDGMSDATDGKKGTVFQTKCFPGHFGPFCELCPIGTFKQSYSYGNCMPCINKPENAYYDQRGEIRAGCHYQCNHWESSETNKECLNPLSSEFEELGGLIPFLVLMFMFFFISLIMFITFTNSSKDVRFWMEDQQKRLYLDWFKSDKNQERGETTIDDISLNNNCIWAHQHRMYFVGNNSIGHPWIVPKDFPADSLAEEDIQTLNTFIDNYNAKTHWGAFDKLTFRITTFMYYPLSKVIHDWTRKIHFNELRAELMSAFPENFWKDHGTNKTMRLGCSPDHMTAFIDFLDFSQEKSNWRGLRVPRDILIAGAGTYNHPYNLDYLNDPYVKSIVLMNLKYLQDKLPAFMENFNSDLGKLCFYKLHSVVESDLMSVVKWVEKANRIMFNHFNLKCVLYVCENQTVLSSDDNFKSFRQVRKSFPLESIFIESFPKVFSDLLSYLKLRLHSDKSEIRILMSFKRFSRYHQMGTRQRIESMMQMGEKAGNSRSAYKALVSSEQSVLFSQADTEINDSQVTFVGTPKRPDQDKQEDKNDPTGKVPKLYNTEWRAFSHSIEDCKAFEKAIRKPRNDFQHQLYGIRKALYAIYLLFINHQGSPTATLNTEDFTCMFMIYSMVLALDITNLINFTHHIFRQGDDNFENFGWVFFFVFFGVPYLSPCFAFWAALKGSPKWLKITGQMNAMCICFNYPLTLLACVATGDDPFYLVFVVWMLIVKCLLSFISGKIRMYLYNPKYGENIFIIKDIYNSQLRKRNKQIEILGPEVVGRMDQAVDDPNRRLLEGFGNALDVDQLHRRQIGMK